MKIKHKKEAKSARFWFRCDVDQLSYCEDNSIDLADHFRKLLNTIYTEAMRGRKTSSKKSNLSRVRKKRTKAPIIKSAKDKSASGLRSSQRLHGHK